MTFLPVVERELRVASRRPGTYWGRAVAALVAIVLGANTFALSGGMPSVRVGGLLFGTFAWLAFFWCVFTGARHTAACISAERREGTLGLLFLTDLRGYDIVLGKLTASSIAAFQGLLAFLPVIAVPLLLGGVLPAQYARVAAALVATVFYSLALGMFVSTWCTNDRRATTLTGLLLATVTAGPWIAASVWTIPQMGASPPDLLLLLSPAYVHLLSVHGSFSGSGWGNYGLALGILIAEGIALLALTSSLLPRLCHDRGASARAVRWRACWRRCCERPLGARSRHRTQLLEVNPFLWLAARGRGGPASVWLFLAITCLAFVCVWVFSTEMWLEGEVALSFILSTFLHAALRCWIAFAATRQLAEDRRTGGLELLLSTPLDVPRILEGQYRALGRQFGKPIVAVLVLDALLCWRMFGLMHSETGWNHAILFFSARAVILVADAFALGWFGMWRAMTTRSATDAAAATLFRILVVPWIVLIALGGLLATTQPYIDSEDVFQLAVVAWCIIGLITDVISVKEARGGLSARFRLAASEPRKRPWWRGLSSVAQGRD
ncbi:MAG: ABC transporter permease [Verrucomicrobia bacterium]|jgi:ABC-type Na+ efflux pump permease subunit|nr:ABC transporter permease [Verrucomicrobiota bacterium]OQC63567.1 MAG: ABC-2 family transporter protein [Verrucomicrobia bacterium ADurb.Bin006]MDI9381008.1 ABC transporter permease [Verrucomicrobiota bacterium]NMD19118.1 ABC transporter permease [Verrucomicrobiota bacterium]HOA60455.1 ABC transporter permease [Verrucomicrobiota bacterium]